MTAPAELTTIGLDAARFRKAGPNEYHGPCPFCGGSDRFRVHTDKPFPHWYCVCREGTGCGFSGWADRINEQLRQPLTAERMAEYAQRAAQAEAARQQETARRLREFTDSELWAELHRRMTDANRAWWRAQGIPDEMQDFWQLGFSANTPFGSAYTIPYFDNQFNAINMQYRLTRTDTGDKYRWAGVGYSSYFTAWPTVEFDQAVICEGAKKAMVFANALYTEGVQVFGVPSKSDSAGLKPECGRVWVMLDPDATARAHELAAEIGPSARVVELTGKADDLIVKHGAGKKEFRAFFRQAVRPNGY